MPTSQTRGYVLENQITHARLFPVKSNHAFVYPSLSLLVSLNALEDHALDLGRGWIFGYGGRWARLLGLRPHPYLRDNGGTIRSRLEQALQDRGLDEAGFDDAWMMTMPSLLGFEGINPLTVYFCYRPGDDLYLVVLEVHNTFGESHVYCLETGKQDDKTVPTGYGASLHPVMFQCLSSFDHQWTFPRAFHVSPFNDRNGFYKVSVKNPSHSPIGFSDDDVQSSPQPTVRVDLYTATEENTPTPDKLKLTATLRPIRSLPLTTPNLLSALSRAPFDLFLSFARIAYVAWILHYKKRLDVYIRPEPVPVLAGEHPAGGVRWIDEGLFEGYARRLVEDFLQRRVRETKIAVVLVPGNPSIPTQTFTPDSCPGSATLTITYLSARLFTIIFLSPSPQHALLLGAAEHVFFASSAEHFCDIFAAPPSHSMTRRQRWRSAPLRKVPLPLDIPDQHALDTKSFLGAWLSATVVWSLLFLDRFEEWVFWATRARPLAGTEPWKQWYRAALVHGGKQLPVVPKQREGSFRRELK